MRQDEYYFYQVINSPSSLIMKNKKLSDFFSSQPLYSPVLLDEDYVNPIGVEGPFDFQGTTFSHYCVQEQETRTFEIELPKSSSDFWGKQMGGVVPKEVLHDDKLDFIHHFVGNCRSCKIFHIDFLVHVWSTEPISVDLLRTVRRERSFPPQDGRPVQTLDIKHNHIYIEKVGVNPQTKLILDKTLTKYFDRETNNWYFKGKKAISENLGIGAFAYFRRIIEKELFSIVNDISKLNSSDSARIDSLIIDYNKHGKVYPLYQNIFNYLPKSLQSLGDNPLELLYKQTSQGLHNITEQECLDKAAQIDLILTFVIKKINEEKSEILDVRNAMKLLKSSE